MCNEICVKIVFTGNLRVDLPLMKAIVQAKRNVEAALLQKELDGLKSIRRIAH